MSFTQYATLSIEEEKLVFRHPTFFKKKVEIDQQLGTQAEEEWRTICQPLAKLNEEKAMIGHPMANQYINLMICGG